MAPRSRTSFRTSSSRHLRPIRGDGSIPTRPFEPYLAQIARTVAVDHWRRMRRYVPVDVEYLIEQLKIDARSTLDDDDWSDGETQALVRDYLASIDDDSRRVHDALYVRGMSQREAAEFLGLGRQVVRTKEAKLRDGFGEMMSRTGRVDVIPLRSAAGNERD